MKQQGPELGNLSSRFFAYVQLKKKDIVRTGELLPILDITESQERDLFRRLAGSGWIVRIMRGVYLVPSRIPAGGRYSPGIALILRKLMEEMDGSYQICGPSAFNFYGFDTQIPNITYVYNNRISGSRTIGNLSFQLIKIDDKRLGSTNTIKTSEGISITYSSKARTLMDAVYDWSRFNSLPRGYSWIRQEMKNDIKIASKLIDTTVQYGNQASLRRIGYLLESLIKDSAIVNQLEKKLSNSKALIPLIPTRPARGKANRTWGVIVNE